MTVRAIFKPGQKGTRKLVGEYGEQLVAVRYRYDENSNKRFKTVELIVDESEWQYIDPNGKKPDPEQFAEIKTSQVKVRIGWQEHELRDRIKAIGGKWSEKDHLWYVNDFAIRGIGLADRIVA